MLSQVVSGTRSAPVAEFGIAPLPQPSEASASGRRFVDHEWRARVLGEVHARPFFLSAPPRAVLHYAFMTAAAAGEAERARLNALCEARGEPGVSPAAGFHRVPFGTGVLRWERHSEFSTYTWEGPLDPDLPAFAGSPTEHPFGSAFVAPGPLIVAVLLELRAGAAVGDAMQLFDPTSLCASRVHDGRARVLTDFRQDGDGRTRILVLDDGMSPQTAGALVQRLLEIETYRTLALLGLPLAHECMPEIRELEERLTEISTEIPDSRSISANRDLLHTLSALAARAEALAATSSFRFGATRAYDEIVAQRLRAIGEEPEEGFSTWTAFLARRLNPAMRTCLATERRLETLSRRLSHAADLLRTRVDVELEQQNRDLLDSMNRRARLQLRLQQTVEGLSVAAVSYYIVGLIGYAVKGIEAAGVAVNDGIVVALSVPVVLAAVWWIVRRIRRAHGDEPERGT